MIESLEQESKAKEEELSRIQRKVRERREAIARGADQLNNEAAFTGGRSEQLLQRAADIRYTHLQQEVDSLKLQLKEIALREKDAPTFRRPERIYSKMEVPDLLDYSH
jgi:hypothetical protein